MPWRIGLSGSTPSEVAFGSACQRSREDDLVGPPPGACEVALFVLDATVEWHIRDRDQLRRSVSATAAWPAPLSQLAPNLDELIVHLAEAYFNAV